MASSPQPTRLAVPRSVIRVGMVGCGVVGNGILKLLEDNRTTIEGRLGAPIEIRRVVARDPEKVRPGIDPALLSFDVADVLDDPDVDIVVEVMGGLSPADYVVQTAIERGKHVVTANKALLAERGDELLELAEERGVDLYFEAAVGGGIPIIRLLRESLSSDRIVSLRGIVNGTSNYILSRMLDQPGLTFDTALREAQEKGYAEADPTLDVGGGDAAHKLTILATLAYGARVSPEQVPTEGIDIVDAIDMEMARRFGYVIKPLAIASMVGSELDLRVCPALVRERSVLASIGGALNAVFVEGAMLGPCLISGLGAGAEPTAMSVVSDIVDVGRNLLVGAHGRVPSRAFKGEHLVEVPLRDPGDNRCRHYLRFAVRDRPGILARIAGVLGAFEVSIEQMVQDERSTGDVPVSIVMTTHESKEMNVRLSLREIQLLHDVVEPPVALRIEET